MPKTMTQVGGSLPLPPPTFGVDVARDVFGVDEVEEVVVVVGSGGATVDTVGDPVANEAICVI
tara:strand:+ start:722 stop:910 length:189 start_codon:yes stop_codon:yes gene_type:complete